MMSDNRSHLLKDETWDLSTVFPTDEAWEVELNLLYTELDSAKIYKGKLKESASVLVSITENYLDLLRRIEKVYVYASMKNDQDTTVAKYQEFQAKASSLYATFSEVFSFYEPELMSLETNVFSKFLEEEPALKPYKHYFDKIFAQKNMYSHRRKKHY